MTLTHRRCAAALVAALVAAVSTTPAIAAAKSEHAPAKPAKPASQQQKPLDIDAFNNARDTPLLRRGNQGPAVVRAQILLDRAWYSSGEIDGRFGANLERMVRAYQLARGLKPTGTLTADTWKLLMDDGEPRLVRYTVTPQDVAGPFEKTPKEIAEQAKMKALVYESALEAIAERFHTSVDYLHRLNGPGDVAAGTQIVVPNVGATAAPAKAVSIEISKQARVLYVLDAERRPIAGFPISIGNEKNDPLPIGMMAVRNEVKNPSFTYDPALLKTAKAGEQKTEVPPGPNNPVGTFWLGLTKPHWGIHGTPQPGNVGHSETNGCIHLTNWDVERLSTLAKAGFKVDVRP